MNLTDLVQNGVGANDVIRVGNETGLTGRTVLLHILLIRKGVWGDTLACTYVYTIDKDVTS